jgi:hypothetical protein
VYLLILSHDTTDTFVKKIVSNKKAKFIYRSLIDNIVQNPTDKFLKWEELLFALQKVHKCVSFNFILYKNEFVAIILCRNLN